MKNPIHRRTSGFTLVELLVVISIIAVLATLTFLGFTRMRAAADKATTVSNIRQLQGANQSYATDHNGRYASYYIIDENGLKGYWSKSPKFLQYIIGEESQETVASSKFTVPISTLDPVVVRAKKRLYDGLWASYGMVSEFMREGGAVERYVSMSKVTDPTRSAAFVTATDLGVKYASRKSWWSSPVEGKTSDGKMAFRHGDKAVVAYYDGSTGVIGRGDIDRFDSQGGATGPFWKADF